MDIEQLRAFTQVARDGSFTKAACMLDVSQPSISARIAALERELGGRGAIFATRAMVADDLAAGRLRAVPVSDLPPLSYENAIVSLHDVSLPRAVAAFMDVLRAEIGALGADTDTMTVA